jgi:hypothetical protein
MFSFNPYALYGIERAETHKNAFTGQRRNGMAGVIRGYRQLAKATINEKMIGIRFCPVSAARARGIVAGRAKVPTWVPANALTWALPKTKTCSAESARIWPVDKPLKSADSTADN